MENLAQGTLVEYNLKGLNGKGIVVGMVFEEFPSYIIEPEISIKTDSYPWTHFVCPENNLKVVGHAFKNPEDRKDSPHHYTNRID
jgi:hypothetical protein